MRRWLFLLSFPGVLLAAVLASMAAPVRAGLGGTPDASSLLGSYLAGRVARAQNDNTMYIAAGIHLTSGVLSLER